MTDAPRRLVIPRTGKPDVLRVEPCEVPQPGPGELRIRGAYAGINFADLMMRLGLYRPRPEMPFTPGYEVSGVVDAVGLGVPGFEVGARVVAALASGGQQTHVLAQAAQTMLLPDEIELETAAAIPVTYLTAWHMLVHLGHVQADECVLIHGIAGGVGTAALQIAKLFLAEPVFGTASPNKAEGVLKRRAKLLARSDFAADLLRQTKGRGADHILDPIGGQHLRESYRCLAPGGRLYAFGLSAAAPSSRFRPLAALRALFGMRGFGLADMMLHNRGIFGVHMGTFSDHALLAQHLGRILEHVQDGKLEPVIDRVFPLAEAAAAHEHIHARRNFGKVLLELG
jgi:NADPH:quinone reductase-like Zn-dependent oxidoreductase